MEILDLPPGAVVVVFSSKLRLDDEDVRREYEIVAKRMVEAASRAPGFLRVDSVRSPDGSGITVSYWRTEEDVARWRADEDHSRARRRGREVFYQDFYIVVSRLERSYDLRSSSKL